jgi:hypothetical protein
MCLASTFSAPRIKGPSNSPAPAFPLPGDGAYTYLDTTRSLRGDRSYHYALRTVSTSHVESNFSDTVSVMPLTNRPAPLPPRDLGAQVDGEVAIVSWEDQSSDALWQAYAVLRSRPGAKVDTLWRNTNFLIDTLDATGQASSYRVLSMNVFGASSSAFTFGKCQGACALPSSPSGVQASAVARQGAAHLAAARERARAALRCVPLHPRQRACEAGQRGVQQARTFRGCQPGKGALNFYFVRSVAATGAESGPSREVGVGL